MTIHLVITPLCNRSCEYCCNKQYDIQNLPVVTDEELKNADMLCLTGGEPFAYSNPCGIANYYHNLYPKLKIIVYTNAYELLQYLESVHNMMNFARHGIAGLNICVKGYQDIEAINFMERYFTFKPYEFVGELPLNRIIIMDNLWKEADLMTKIDDIPSYNPNIKIIRRKWQEHFVPAPDSLFRRL